MRDERAGAGVTSAEIYKQIMQTRRALWRTRICRVLLVVALTGVAFLALAGCQHFEGESDDWSKMQGLRLPDLAQRCLHPGKWFHDLRRPHCMRGTICFYETRNEDARAVCLALTAPRHRPAHSGS